MCLIETGWVIDSFITPNNKTIMKNICGDFYLKGNETCEDGNALNNDGCSSTCLLETGYHTPV